MVATRLVLISDVAPHVLLIFPPHAEEPAETLKGIVHHQRAERSWVISLYDEASVQVDPCCWVRSRAWSGVIGACTTPALVQTCARQGVPLVAVGDAPAVEGVASVAADQRAIGRTGAAYFLDRRFRHFGFCGFSNRTWARERREGFVDVLGRTRHRCELFEVELPDEVTPAWEARQQTLLIAWLQCLPAGTAVMACNDRRAQQVLRAAQAAGRRVPDEVAVLGANNDAMRCELAELSISSVATNPFEIGRRAAEQLAELMAGRPSAGAVQIAPRGVVTRQSSDVLGQRDEHVAVALSYIREHACRGLTVDEVLRHVPVSRSNLEHKLRRYIGWSPQVEIRRVQVAKICQLLTETNLSLKEIADRAGFVHVEYMCVVFKRVTGCTPGQYRHQHVQTIEQPSLSATA